tara:strand:- start:54 stop:923 length:870 start_codon:yes stop_codon:yes gene_type:complete
MATFQVQIEGITQLSISATPTTAELTQFLTDGAKEIISILPPHLLALCAKEVTFTPQAVGSEGSASLLNTGKVLNVFRGNYEARQISPKKKHKANLSSSIHYVDTADPVFYIQNNYINILPSGGAGKYDEVEYPAVAFGDSAIAYFPDEAEYLVVLYGAMKTLVAHIGALTIPPNVSDDTGTTETLTSDMDAITSDQLGTDDDFDDYNKWFVALGEMIEDDEDIELASAQIEKINAYVNSWNIQLQGNLADFQRYSAILQSVKSDYMQGISMLKSGGLPQAQPQQQRGR